MDNYVQETQAVYRYHGKDEKNHKKGLKFYFNMCTLCSRDDSSMVEEHIMHIFQRARENAFDAHATWYLFNRRVKRYKLFINLTTWIGLCLPASIGLLVAFQGSTFFKYFLNITIAIGAVQFLLTAWSLVSRTMETYSNAVRCREQNIKLKAKWQGFIDLRDIDDKDLEKIFESLLNYHNDTTVDDVAQDVKDSEIRRGHRAALIAFNQECAGCQEKPTDMKSKKCPVCGNFSNDWIFR